jgi:hypothetical protein
MRSCSEMKGVEDGLSGVTVSGRMATESGQLIFSSLSSVFDRRPP